MALLLPPVRSLAFKTGGALVQARSGFCPFLFFRLNMQKKQLSFLACTALLVTLAGSAWSQPATAPSEPQNVVQLSATGAVEVQQDLLVLTLDTTRDGKDANTVQAQVREALDKAVLEARRAAEPGQMDVRTGNFSLYPRYSQGTNGQSGQINGWQGSAELVLEGRDFARITQTAARINSMTIRQVAFDLSREQRAKVERDAQAQAIDNFKAQAIDLTRTFGFGSYTLREVSVNSNSHSPGPRPRMMAMQSKSAMEDAAPIAVEAGKSTVTVNVSGSVQMH